MKQKEPKYKSYGPLIDGEKMLSTEAVEVLMGTKFDIKDKPYNDFVL